MDIQSWSDDPIQNLWEIEKLKWRSRTEAHVDQSLVEFRPRNIPCITQCLRLAIVILCIFGR